MAERILVCGSRDWTDGSLIRDVLKGLQPLGIECVIEGDARGADRLGAWAALQLGIPVRRFPAHWDKHGKLAGRIRNDQMLYEGKPTLVLAFHDHIEYSKGTSHMIAIAKQARVPVRLVQHIGTISL